MSKRAVITGIGVVAPNGIGKETFWHALRTGRSGVKKIALFDPTPFPCRFAGEVHDFSPLEYFERREARRLVRSSQFAVAAARMALTDAGLNGTSFHGAPPGITIGITGTSIAQFEKEHRAFLKGGPDQVSPFGIMAASPNAAATEIARLILSPALQNTLANDCNSGLDAIGFTFEQIRRGEITCGICGGTDTPITPLLLGLFCKSNLIPRTAEHPEEVSRPFDLTRTGGLMAEGAALFTMEERDSALRRNVPLLAEVIGFGTSTLPEEGGFEDAMRQALAQAQAAPEDIRYISAHGPSDPHLDAVETKAIRTLLGAHAYRVPVSSIKSMIGNPLAAGGPLQVAGVLMGFRDGIIPPTINYRYPDPECDLDYVPNTARYNNVAIALVNSRGIGGKSSSLVLCHG